MTFYIKTCRRSFIFVFTVAYVSHVKLNSNFTSFTKNDVSKKQMYP